MIVTKRALPRRTFLKGAGAAIGLPLLDGLSTATQIKKLKDLDETPIVAVTAYRDILEQAKKAGCADVLYKPIDQPALNDLLKKHLDGH